jgi:hypothetical protein
MLKFIVSTTLLAKSILTRPVKLGAGGQDAPPVDVHDSEEKFVLDTTVKGFAVHICPLTPVQAAIKKRNIDKVLTIVLERIKQQKSHFFSITLQFIMQISLLM